MTRDRYFDQLLSDVLEEGPREAPDVLLDTVLDNFPSIKQRGRRQAALGRILMPATTMLKMGAAAAAVVLVVAFGYVLWATGPSATVGDRGSTPTAAPPSASPSAASSASAAVVAPEVVIPIKREVDSVMAMSAFGDTVWTYSDDGLVRIDAGTNEATTVPIPIEASAFHHIAATENAVWVTDSDNNLVYRVDPQTNEVVATIQTEETPEVITVAEDGIWAGGVHIDPATNEVVGETPFIGRYGLGTFWYTAGTGAISRVDPDGSDDVVKIDLPPSVGNCEIDGFTDIVWTWCYPEPVVARIDPETNKVVATVDFGGPIGGPITGLTSDLAASWWLAPASPDGPGRFVRVDLATHTVDRTISIGDGFDPDVPVVAGDALWVADEQAKVVGRFPLDAFAAP
ncbi:MAG: hypothetical protein H0X16_06670 [Chloroflexi bacterium]|nr:hypothetical protein [Chloroflexota bacterium]